MIRKISDKTEWQKIIEPQLGGSGGFLKSWSWGEFQKSVGRNVFRFASERGACQLIEQNLPAGKKYWFIPKAGLIDSLVDEARKENIIFIRFEPAVADEIPIGAQKTIHVSPPATMILDLTKTEEELFAQMHEKTRYNIRLAAKKDVVIKKVGKDSFENFWQLMEETGRRDKFRTHSKLYYQKMVEALGGSDDCKVSLWQAEFDGKILAAGLWAESGGTITYLHGASSSENRNLMAPYLLHWQVIKDAKSRGINKYDLWGIAPHEEKGFESWSGLTRFKTGFGGKTEESPGTYDLPINIFWYKVYGFLRKVRRGI